MLRKNTGSVPTVQRLCLHGLEALSLGIRASELWGEFNMPGAWGRSAPGIKTISWEDDIEQFGGHIYLSWWLYIFSTVAIYAQCGGNIYSVL